MPHPLLRFLLIFKRQKLKRKTYANSQIVEPIELERQEDNINQQISRLRAPLNLLKQRLKSKINLFYQQ